MLCTFSRHPRSPCRLELTFFYFFAMATVGSGLHRQPPRINTRTHQRYWGLTIHQCPLQGTHPHLLFCVPAADTGTRVAHDTGTCFRVPTWTV